MGNVFLQWQSLTPKPQILSAVYSADNATITINLKKGAKYAYYYAGTSATPSSWTAMSASQISDLKIVLSSVYTKSTYYIYVKTDKNKISNMVSVAVTRTWLLKAGTVITANTPGFSLVGKGINANYNYPDTSGTGVTYANGYVNVYYNANDGSIKGCVWFTNNAINLAPYTTAHCTINTNAGSYGTRFILNDGGYIQTCTGTHTTQGSKYTASFSVASFTNPLQIGVSKYGNGYQYRYIYDIYLQ